MNTRENLRTNILKFNSAINNTEVFNGRWSVKKTDFMEFGSRINAQIINDFESPEKFNFFLDFIKSRKGEFYKVEDSFLDDSLDKEHFLRMGNLLLGVAEKLK